LRDRKARRATGSGIHYKDAISRYSLRIMFTHLRRLAALFMRTRSPFHPFNPPSDPYAAVREPRPVKPGGRSSAVALREPETPASTRAVGGSRMMLLALVASGGMLTALPLHSQNAPQASEKPFASGGRIDIHLSGGEYEIRAAAETRIRVTLAQKPGGEKIEVKATGSQATINVTNTPNNFGATIEVPKLTHLAVHLTAGNLTITGVSGDKDIDSYAGNVTIGVPDPNEYASVDTSVKAGDLNARPFGVMKSGLLQSFKTSGKGKFKLRAWLGAGNLELRDK
jgi:hypothetical protein